MSLRCAFKGIAHVFLFEKNFRMHLIIALTMMILGIYMRLNALEWVILLSFVCLVLVTEIINSCLERFLDAALPFKNNKTRVIKDMAAGAVLVASVFSVIAGIIIFLPKIFC